MQINYSIKKVILLSMLVLGTITVENVFAADNKNISDSTTDLKAEAILKPTQNNTVSGMVYFYSLPQGGLKIVADIKGLTPGMHGFHIHEKGDCSAPDGSSAGSHFNPTHMPHGAPVDTQPHHMGDLGNLIANAAGISHYESTNLHLSLTGIDTIIGRSVIVHTSGDDLHSQPTGNSGARAACGVIQSKTPNSN